MIFLYTNFKINIVYEYKKSINDTKSPLTNSSVYYELREFY